MRKRSELYNILVDELKIDKAKATEILDNAFALSEDEAKKKNEKIKELKEKYVGKLLYIDTDYKLPTCIFVNDIKETSSLNYFNFVGPYIILDENEYHFYDNEDAPLALDHDEIGNIEVVNDIENITFDKKQFCEQYLFYKLIGKRVKNCMNKFIDECKFD